MNLLYTFLALKLYMAFNVVGVLAFFLDLHSHSTFPAVTEIFNDHIEMILQITDYMPFIFKSAIKQN